MAADHDVAEYYLRTARVAMHNHGLNSDYCAALAAWAQAAARVGDTERGMLVSGYGRVWAETVHPPIPPEEPPSWRAVRPPWCINPATWPGGQPPQGRGALGKAMDIIKDKTGEPVAHILYWEVCTGWVGMWGPNEWRDS